MKSVVRMGFLGAVGAAVLLTLATPSYAQRGGGRGRGGGFGYSRAQLASLKEVQADLKLTDEQKKLATEAVEKLNKDRQELFSAGPGGDPTEMREKMTKMNKEADATVVGKLDDAQKKRLTEIYVQTNGTNALADEEVQKALKLTEEQVKKLAEARQANQEAMMAAFGELRDASQEERQEKMATVRKEADEKLFAAITPEQKTEFEKLGGAKLEIDLSPLAPRGFGGGGGGGRPPRN